MSKSVSMKNPGQRGASAVVPSWLNDDEDGPSPHETFGDGHYCTHHPDDPAHNADCYDYDKFYSTGSNQRKGAGE